MTHPTATPERVIALVAAVAGDTEGYSRIEIDLSGNRDAYARIVDTLDALAWLTPDNVRRYQRNEQASAWERLLVGNIEIAGPLGFTPASDRFGLSPVHKLSERTLEAVRDESARLTVLDGGDAA